MSNYPPIPHGVPVLMPYQDQAFNGDTFLGQEFLRLKDKHGIKAFIETGTCYGSSTLWLAENFDWGYSIESSKQYHDVARKRMEDAGMRFKAELVHGKSEDLMPKALRSARPFDRSIPRPVICFLDAHWHQSCPLLSELNAIADAGIRPCIVIHDFQVPGTDFGFDSMPDGRPFDIDLVRPYLDRIYGEGKWTHNYPTEVMGAKRGWVSIEPME